MPPNIFFNLGNLALFKSLGARCNTVCDDIIAFPGVHISMRRQSLNAAETLSAVNADVGIHDTRCVTDIYDRSIPYETVDRWCSKMLPFDHPNVVKGSIYLGNKYKPISYFQFFADQWKKWSAKKWTNWKPSNEVSSKFEIALMMQTPTMLYHQVKLFSFVLVPYLFSFVLLHYSNNE